MFYLSSKSSLTEYIFAIIIWSLTNVYTFFLVPDSCCKTIKKTLISAIFTEDTNNTLRFALVRNIGSSPSVAIFQHRVYNSYVILELVPSTVIFWTEFSCCRKNYSNKAMLFLSWSRRYKNCMVVIIIWSTVAKYKYLKLQWNFYLIRICFRFAITAKTLYVHMSYTAGVL
jgi:hypothetical protein